MLTSFSTERFVALDVHKHYAVVGAVNAQQQVVLTPRRVDLEDLANWSSQHLCMTDAVVLEATTNAWHLCDQLRPLVCVVTVAHPQLVKLITTARVKTDARDTLHLARLLAAGLIPTVWIPPKAGSRVASTTCPSLSPDSPKDASQESITQHSAPVQHCSACWGRVRFCTEELVGGTTPFCF